MIITIVLILAFFALLIFWLIGLFDKKIGRNVSVILFHLKRLRVTRKNVRKIRRQTRQAKRIMRRQKFGLLWKKLRNSYQNNQDNKKSAPK